MSFLTRITLSSCLLVSLFLFGCSRSPNIVQTFYQLNVSDATLDEHLMTLQRVRGIRQVTHAHDSSNKATLTVYIDSSSPYEAREALRQLGYQRVRD